MHAGQAGDLPAKHSNRTATCKTFCNTVTSCVLLELLDLVAKQRPAQDSASTPAAFRVVLLSSGGRLSIAILHEDHDSYASEQLLKIPGYAQMILKLMLLLWCGFCCGVNDGLPKFFQFQVNTAS